MTKQQIDDSTARNALRLWPGVAAVVVQWMAWLVAPLVVSGGAAYGVLAGVACGAVVLVWWLFFSRAPWLERLGAVVLMVVAVAATSFVVHPSISNGMMGMMLPIYSIPTLSLALVAWAVTSRHLSPGPRRTSMVAAMLLACGVFTLVRTGGITGEGESDLHWRWTATPEERLLAQAENRSVDASAGGSPAPSIGGPPSRAREVEARAGADVAALAPDDASPVAERGDRSKAMSSVPAAPKSVPAGPATRAPETARADGRIGGEPDTQRATGPATSDPDMRGAEWPGFRGPNRDSVVRGVRIEADWSQHPPTEVWRRPIGPGWSSFAVHGDLLYTQEQRGQDEIVACYRVSTGEPVWQHRDPVRFWESNGGAGPRATPTLAHGRVYTMGATGIVNALDAGSGSLVWSRNAATDTGKTIPDWGIASSPLVIDDLVIVAVAGQLAAYDAAGGSPRWVGQPGGGGYSSPHLATIDGVPQVLLLRGARTIGVAPRDGTLLWEHSWQPAVSIVQPALVGSDVLVASGDAMGGLGIRRLAVTHSGAEWSVEERWTSRGLKPYFNDLVVHQGHAFGFDGSILACIDLEGGERKWKGGRFGHGQLVLLPEQDLLLVLSEDGELALVKAAPDRFAEVARVRVLDGKTWNHPVLVGDLLLVRNGEEMAAFRLSAGPTSR